VIGGKQFGDLVCDGVEGRFLKGDEAATLREQAVRAEAQGAGAIFLPRGRRAAEGMPGDPFVLAAGLSASVPRLLLGVEVGLPPEERHPTMLAREATSLDLVCGGRTVLCFGPPFARELTEELTGELSGELTEELAEAIALCRAMWRDGDAVSDGPAFPVPGAVNRPRPHEGSPLVALDLAVDAVGAVAGVGASLAGMVDLVLRPTDDAAVCRVERP
jgi:alkanesulfonate monooxygenase SsuD/methylene tetrahydromethanopterin reductase-like flavin-dependent oxidoreductase (luciferase family)